jgi:hypothetical protein
MKNDEITTRGLNIDLEIAGLAQDAGDALQCKLFLMMLTAVAARVDRELRHAAGGDVGAV